MEAKLIIDLKRDSLGKEETMSEQSEQPVKQNSGVAREIREFSRFVPRKHEKEALFTRAKKTRQNPARVEEI